MIDHSPVKSKEKGLFFHSLQLLINSGVRFTRSLGILAARSRNIRFRRVLNTVVYDMENRGSSFSQAIQKYPNVFVESEVKMAYSGEISGRMEETLESIARQLQKNLEFEVQLRSALMYPLTVLGAIVLAIIAVMFLVVPKFVFLFAEFEGTLPLSTRILIGMSDFFRNYWWFVLLVVVGSVVLFRNWKSSGVGQRLWDEFTLQVPLFKALINDVQTVRITTNLAALIESSVPVPKALQILSEIMPNVVVKEAVAEIEQEVRTGKAIHQSFTDKAVFDPIIGEMIEIGEKGGRISETLKKVGAQYELEVDAQLKNLTTLMEPLVIVLVGSAVVFMAMAIMTPIFKLQELVTASA
jgi:type II secretory pathway component PulF